jgi:hypothetical protein
VFVLIAFSVFMNSVMELYWQLALMMAMLAFGQQMDDWPARLDSTKDQFLH